MNSANTRIRKPRGIGSAHCAVHVNNCQVGKPRSTMVPKQLASGAAATNLCAAVDSLSRAHVGDVGRPGGGIPRVLRRATIRKPHYLGREGTLSATTVPHHDCRDRCVGDHSGSVGAHLAAEGTFLGLLGAGLAIALREPLLSVAGRVAIFAGKMYSVGDRIQLETMSGDVIDVGFFYTRMMEIGNWIGGDQVSGRIVQLPNSKIFGNPIFN